MWAACGGADVVVVDLMIPDTNEAEEKLHLNPMKPRIQDSGFSAININPEPSDGGFRMVFTVTPEGTRQRESPITA